MMDMKTQHSLDLTLAKLEFNKDFGIRNPIAKERTKLLYLGKDTNGNCYYQVSYLDNGLPKTENWVLERIDLSYLTERLPIMKTSNKRICKNEVVQYIEHTMGYLLVNQDIEIIQSLTNGWNIIVNKDSIRFKGEFVIQRKDS